MRQLILVPSVARRDDDALVDRTARQGNASPVAGVPGPVTELDALGR